MNEDAIVECRCGKRLRWASEETCANCARPPLPDDDVLEAAFNRGLLQDEIRRQKGAGVLRR